MHVELAPTAYANATPFPANVPDALIVIGFAMGGTALLILALVAVAAVRFWLQERRRARGRPGFVPLARAPFDDELERRRRRHGGGDHAA